MIVIPKLQYRYSVEFFNFGKNIDTKKLVYQISSIQLPTQKFLDDRMIFENFAITVTDDSDSEAQKAIISQIQKQIENIFDCKFECTITLLGSVGEKITIYKTFGSFIQDLNYGNLDYSNGGAVTMIMNISIDNLEIINF